jgi:malate permease and related proteins
MAVYVLGPCLVFSLIVTSELDAAQFGQLIAFSLAVTLSMVAIALAVGRALGWSPAKVDGLVLSVAFLNAGNFGLSVVLFSFGDEGLALATVIFVATNLLSNTVAAFFAARSNGGARQALLKTLRLPGLYAFLLALLVRLADAEVPAMLMSPVSLVGRAAVPVMLMMLGLQLSQTRLGTQYREVGLGVFLRLVVGALVGIGLAPLMGLQGLARNVAVVEAATPTAVTSSLMAIEFGADAEYVTGVIFFSTLFSAVTLTILLALL